MKKVFIVALMSALFSCSSEKEELAGSNRPDGNAIKELLAEMNYENPLFEVGVMHNTLVESFFNQLTAGTRGNGFSEMTQQEIADSIRSFTIQEANVFLTSNNITSYTIQDFAGDYDDALSLIADKSPNEISLSSPEIMAASTLGQIKYYNKLESILKSGDTNLLSILQKIKTLRNQYSSILNSQEMMAVNFVSAIAANSSQYWHENIDEYQTLTNVSVIDYNWIDAVIADVFGGLQYYCTMQSENPDVLNTYYQSNGNYMTTISSALSIYTVIFPFSFICH